MINRIWDPGNKFTEGVLKEYENWVLEVSHKQHTLGCYIIFAKRPVERISGLTDEEIKELKDIMKEVENALLKSDAFRPDRFNYLQLGNVVHQLHFHGVPRYSSPRVFDNKEWSDKNWGKPVILSNEVSSNELIRKIRDAIKPLLR